MDMDSVSTEMTMIAIIEVRVIDDVVATLQIRNIRRVDDVGESTVTEVLVMTLVMCRLVEIVDAAAVIEVGLGLVRGLEIDTTNAGIGTDMAVYADTVRDLIPALVLVLLSTGEIGIEAHTALLVGQIKVITEDCLTVLMKIV